MSGRVILAWAVAREPWPDGCMAAALQRLPPRMGRDIMRWRNPMDRQARVLGRLLVRLALETLGEGNPKIMDGITALTEAGAVHGALDTKTRELIALAVA